MVVSSSGAASGAVQRRTRALARERRDNIGRHAGRRSRRWRSGRRRASCRGSEELAAANLQALLNARQSDYRMVVRPDAAAAGGRRIVGDGGPPRRTARGQAPREAQPEREHQVVPPAAPEAQPGRALCGRAAGGAARARGGGAAARLVRDAARGRDRRPALRRRRARPRGRPSADAARDAAGRGGRRAALATIDRLRARRAA